MRHVSCRSQPEPKESPHLKTARSWPSAGSSGEPPTCLSLRLRMRSYSAAMSRSGRPRLARTCQKNQNSESDAGYHSVPCLCAADLGEYLYASPVVRCEAQAQCTMEHASEHGSIN